MGISASGANGLSMSTIKTIFIVGALLVAAGFYLYGPPVTPSLRAAAVSACNEHAGGNFRSYRLHWQTGRSPHWSCWDAGNPERLPVNYGWWVNPFR
jgi:hypothetical protein